MARYKLTTDCFVEPFFLKEGSVIDYDGVPSMYWAALDDDAQAALDKLRVDKPHAGIDPVQALEIVPAPQVTVITEPEAVPEPVQVVTAMTKPEPGLSDGGKAK